MKKLKKLDLKPAEMSNDELKQILGGSYEMGCNAGSGGGCETGCKPGCSTCKSNK